MMSKCLIIEDEAGSYERLSGLLEKYHQKDIVLLGWGKTADQAIQLIKSSPPDLVFFDIQLQETDAFSILGRLPEVNFDLIFTTAHAEYAIRAFKVNALDYLLKPIGAPELDEAVQKHVSRFRQNAISSFSPSFFENLFRAKKIGIPTLKGLDYIAIQDIIRCQADGNYTHIFVRNGDKITVAKTLGEFEKSLEKHHFFRPHNSHLVNINSIKAYHKGKGGYLILDDNTEIEVASRRKEELLKLLKSVE